MQLCTCSDQYIFFFNDTATTEIYTLSLHDALPISRSSMSLTTKAIIPEATLRRHAQHRAVGTFFERNPCRLDRKSTRLNSSHANISYAVFCLKKKTTLS